MGVKKNSGVALVAPVLLNSSPRAHAGVEVHHIRHLKDLNVRGRAPKPAWALQMAARRRKTLVVCRVCHEDIHYGANRSRQNS